jgi:sortase A
LRWDRWLAYVLVVLGAAYAGYSDSGPGESLSQMKSVPAKGQGHAWVIVPKVERPKMGEHFADLIIPKLKAKMPVVEGTDEDELAEGVGHFADSVLPGEPDNSVLSGHRDTVFRHVGELKKGDELLVKTRQGTFVYVITKTWVTKPDDRTVIVPYGKPVLTLTTCYPFTYIGPAPERYIIQSELKEKIDGSSVTTRGG